MKRVLSIVASIVVALFLVTASAEATTMASGSGDNCAPADAVSMSGCDACATGEDGDRLACDVSCTVPAQGVMADTATPFAQAPMRHFTARFLWLAGAPTAPEPHPPRPSFLS